MTFGMTRTGRYFERHDVSNVGGSHSTGKPLQAELPSSSNPHLSSSSKFSGNVREVSSHWLSFVISSLPLSWIPASSRKSVLTRLPRLCQGLEERSQLPLQKGLMRRPNPGHFRCGYQDYTALIRDGLRTRTARERLTFRLVALCRAPRLDAVPVHPYLRRTASATGLVSRR